MSDLRALIKRSVRLPTTVFNAGQHDLGASFFGFGAYHAYLKKAMAVLKNASAHVIMKTTSPVYHPRKECWNDQATYPRRNHGNPGVKLANIVAEQVARELRINVLDQFILRFLQIEDGDGVHCAPPRNTDPSHPDHHYPIEPDKFFEVVSVSCYTTLQAMLNVIAFELSAEKELAKGRARVRQADSQQDHNDHDIAFDWKCSDAIRNARTRKSWHGIRYEASQKEQ